MKGYLWYASNKRGSQVSAFFRLAVLGPFRCGETPNKSVTNALHTQTVIAQSTPDPADSGPCGYYASVLKPLQGIG